MKLCIIIIIITILLTLPKGVSNEILKTNIEWNAIFVAKIIKHNPIEN